MDAEAIIVAAGQGRRFPGEQKKQFLPLAGKPVIAHSLAAFEATPLIRSVLLVVHPEDADWCRREIVERFGFAKVSRIVPGGAERQDSVRTGLEALKEENGIVVIHDGVRPLVSREMIEASIEGAVRFGAVVMAVPSKETIKRVDREGRVLETLDRQALRQIQTPQAFRTAVLREAYRRSMAEGFLGTDDASLVERIGIEVRVLPGDYANIKITTPEDLLVADRLIRERKEGESHARGIRL
jgi:2-C-methyl-D-erythritol 4-phosphate cytidylyltransferase